MVLSLKQIATNLNLVMLRPGEFWKRQKNDENSQYRLLTSYFVPLLICVAIAVFIGELVRSNHLYIVFPLLKSLRKIILITLYYLICVFFTNELMGVFGAEKNKQVARKLVVYSMTPFLLVSVVTGLFPFFYVLDVIVLYSFYIFWLGADELVSLKGRDLKKYAVVNIIVCFTLFSFLSIFLSKLLILYF
jgi:hypothetical protein